jgi:Domain of unknown function (DUF4157)
MTFGKLLKVSRTYADSPFTINHLPLKKMFSKAQQPQQTPSTKATTPFFKPEPTFKSLAPEQVQRNVIPLSPQIQRNNIPLYPLIQAKLTVGQPNDKYEQEADAMADKVVQRFAFPTSARFQTSPTFSAPAPITPFNINAAQRACAACEKEDKDHIQRKESGEMTASPSVESRLSATKGGGNPLPESTRTHMESSIGADFSNVRVHTGGEAVQLSQDLSAHAFTHGSDVYFNSGKFAPDTEGGRHLLAHELVHTVQQGSGVQRMIQRAENDTRIGCATLTDSKSDINTHINTELASLRPATGSAMVSGIASAVGDDSIMTPGRSIIEGWASSLPPTKAALPARATTKYNGVSYGLWRTPFDILNPTMKVNNICIGSDKLGHFFQQGYQYFTIAHTAGQNTSNAVAFGQGTEAGRFGLVTTGVYSNADLAANRKGLDFYNSLAANPNLTFDIASYINADWSEVNNPNFYEASVGEVVWRNLLTGNWSGFMEDNAASKSNAVSLNLNFTTTSNISITGTFTKGSATGTIVGRVIHNTTTPAGATTGTTAISGVTIEFVWVIGLTRGRGIWNSNKENELKGTWGNNTSNNNGGKWEAGKV